MAKKPVPAAAPAEAEKLRRHVRILVDLGRLVGENPNLDRFLDQAVVQVARAVEVDHVKVLRYRRKTADLLMAAGMGWKEGLVRAATFSSDLRSPPGRSFQTAEPVVITDAGNAPGFVISEVLKEHGIVSLANVPVLIDGAAWGVLEVDSSGPRDFSQDTVEFMTAAAAIIGAAVQRQSADRSEARALAEAAAEAQHRDVLLRELQHRVKNNFQIILASIAIQKHRFIEDIPESLEPGVLYISMEYATAAHSCCCGCGEEVVTPFTPTDWKMTFDGETVSLKPSVGSWTLACRSHYVIDRGKVIEAGPWTDEQVDAERRRDRNAKARHYGQVPVARPAEPISAPPAAPPPRLGFWRRVWRAITGR